MTSIRKEFHDTHGEKLAFQVRNSTANDIWTVVKVNSTKKGCFVAELDGRFVIAY